MDIQALGINPADLREMVLDRAARMVADEAHREDLNEYVKTEIRKRIESAFTTTLNTQVDTLLSETLQKMIDTVVQPVDIWGDKVGEPTTIRTTLMEKARDFWLTKVDQTGKPNTTSYSSTTLKTRAEWMIGNVVASEFAEHVKLHMTTILEALKVGLRQDALRMVNAHLDNLIKTPKW